MALEFAREGARVAVSGRRKDRLLAVVAEIEREGGQGLVVTCDVANDADVTRAVEEVVAALGALDVVVANAGFGVGGPFESLSAEDWRRQLDTNVVGLAICVRHALPHLKARRGRVVLVGSVAAFVPGPGTVAYAASKAAVRAIGQTLSVELTGTGVTCTTVHPGFVASEIGQVDNQGHFHAEWEDRRPAALMWTAERAAKVCVKAIYKRRREFVFTGHGKFGASMGMHFPGFVSLVMRWVEGRKR